MRLTHKSAKTTTNEGSISVARTSLPDDDSLIATAKKPGITTEGKTRDQISNEIVQKASAKKTASVQHPAPVLSKTRAPPTPKTVPPSSAVVLPTKFCRRCGAKIPRDSVYCEECGARLVE